MEQRQSLVRRNAAIRQSFNLYLQKGMPTMLAYAKTANDYFLSEERVRAIIAKRNAP